MTAIYPEYFHDCFSCHFLGNEIVNKKTVDVYYCDLDKSIQIRFNNDTSYGFTIPVAKNLYKFLDGVFVKGYQKYFEKTAYDKYLSTTAFE